MLSDIYRMKGMISAQDDASEFGNIKGDYQSPSFIP